MILINKGKTNLSIIIIQECKYTILTHFSILERLSCAESRALNTFINYSLTLCLFSFLKLHTFDLSTF